MAYYDGGVLKCMCNFYLVFGYQPNHYNSETLQFQFPIVMALATLTKHLQQTEQTVLTLQCCNNCKQLHQKQQQQRAICVRNCLLVTNQTAAALKLANGTHPAGCKPDCSRPILWLTCGAIPFCLPTMIFDNASVFDGKLLASDQLFGDIVEAASI